MKNAGFLITAGVVLILGAMVVFWAIGVSNTYNKKLVAGKAHS